MVRSILSEQIECYEGIEYTKDGEEMKTKIELKMCADGLHCVSGKGSFVLKTSTCKFLTSFNLLIWALKLMIKVLTENRFNISFRRNNIKKVLFYATMKTTNQFYNLLISIKSKASLNVFSEYVIIFFFILLETLCNK